MSRHRRLSGAFFIGASGLFFWSASNIIHDNKKVQITFEPTVLTVFGKIGSQINAQVVITNHDDVAITLLGAYQLCDSVCCVEASGFPAVLRAGESVTLTLGIQIGADYGEKFLWPIYTDDLRNSVVHLPILCRPSDVTDTN